MSISFRVYGSVAALAVIGASVPGALPSAGPARAARLTAIVVRGIDRTGAARRLKGTVAVRFFRDGYETAYYADSNGVLRVPPATYLIGMDIPTYGQGGTPVSVTLAERIVRAGTSGGTRTVTVDARLGKPVRVSFALRGASPQFLVATLCASSRADKGQFGISIAGGGGPISLYAIPGHARNLRFIMASVWQGADGSQYGLGATASGIPRHPDFSFRPSGLATLRFEMASGATDGSSGSLNTWFTGPCQASGPSVAQVTIPGRATEHVSAGQWVTQLTINGPSDDGLRVAKDVTAGHAYTATFGRAVYGPGAAALPRFFAARHPGYLTVGLDDIFQDPVASASLASSDGILRLAYRRHVLRTYRFKRGSLFAATLRRSGWYTISLTARPVPPPLGVTRAALSTKVSLTWRFAASASDLADSLNPAPVSVTTFEPQGLNLRNQAGLSSVTPIRLVILRGQPNRGHRIKTVRLEVSRDAGLSWHVVRVINKAGKWMAEVPNPFSCFVSLRSVVTDVKGDSTVETVYRAYEVI